MFCATGAAGLTADNGGTLHGVLHRPFGDGTNHGDLLTVYLDCVCCFGQSAPSFNDEFAAALWAVVVHWCSLDMGRNFKGAAFEIFEAVPRLDEQTLRHDAALVFVVIAGFLVGCLCHQERVCQTRNAFI
ncbi:MAG: hypothetical protein A2289_06235 [Deltaproteobacteria bacterium RIFOXYA12_FULL_58_15]|nr:MAG: hypothetical protein A2289_06235 [Deltaproteobacteria bacterium RIFOXYA12_FULL_58_15]